MAKKRRQPEVHKQPLGEQIENPETYGVRTKPRVGKKSKGEDIEEDDRALPADLSRRVLRLAREQDEEEAGPSGQEGMLSAAAIAALEQAGTDSDDDDEIPSPGPGSVWGGDDDLEFEHVSPEDEAALATFMRPASDAPKARTLGDIIAEKLAQQEQQRGLREGSLAGDGHAQSRLDPRLAKVFRSCGALLSRYTVGKLPKAFKVIPSLRNWEEALWLTEPQGWSPHAMYQATRLFVASMNERMSQRFLNLVLLPAARRDIRDSKKLHPAMFMALKKATFRPAAFFKGILLPLCSYETCTLREAVILSSVLRRTSLPVLHAGAALLRIADMEYSGTNSFFIRVLLDKKYTLPYRVIDALVDHFTRFAREERALPVVWHQSLLCFVQRYKNEIREEDKPALRSLIGRQRHYLVSPEILRELDAGRSRGQKAALSVLPQSATGTVVKEDPAHLAPLILMDDL